VRTANEGEAEGEIVQEIIEEKVYGQEAFPHDTVKHTGKNKRIGIKGCWWPCVFYLRLDLTNVVTVRFVWPVRLLPIAGCATRRVGKKSMMSNLFPIGIIMKEELGGMARARARVTERLFQPSKGSGGRDECYSSSYVQYKEIESSLKKKKKMEIWSQGTLGQNSISNWTGGEGNSKG